MISLNEIRRGGYGTHRFKNVISLGHFCAPAMQLEKLGYRRASYPFDWLIIRDFELVLHLFEYGFEGSEFFRKDAFEQARVNKSVYRNAKTGVRFLHDFNDYETFEAQFDAFQQKYQRRMARFQKDIICPTLFIRYIGSQDELEFIEMNVTMIDSIMKSKCAENEILYVCNSDLDPNIDIIKLNKNFDYNFIEDGSHEFAEWLRKNYDNELSFRKKKNNITKKIVSCIIHCIRKKYIHSQVYEDLD